jgi:hypothetical protein
MALIKHITVVVVLFFLAINLFSPVFANDSEMIHSATYSIDGLINYKKQSGHLCNTGAEMKQTISGKGQLEKVMSLVLVKGKLTVSDNNDFVTDLNTLNNLTVTSAIKLCTPPKAFYSSDGSYIVTEIYYVWRELPLTDALWLDYWQETSEGMWWFTGDGEPSDIEPSWAGQYYKSEESHSLYDDLTKQIWAVKISAEPGQQGILRNDLTAAYGEPMWWKYWDGHRKEGQIYRDYKGRGFPDYIQKPELVDKDRWAYGPHGKLFIGHEYVGDYFTMDQYAYTSKGEIKRFIDISSPYSHALLHEDMDVKGFAEIDETFALQNIKPGDNIPGKWWHMFDIESVKTTTIHAKDRYLSHNAKYDIEGSIDFKKQAGHRCNTGAEMKQTIVGDGLLSKTMDIHMIEGLLKVNDINNFTTAINAKRNITVTTMIELCAPPKQIHDGKRYYLHDYSINEPGGGYFSWLEDDPAWDRWFGRNGFSGLIFGPYAAGDLVNPMLHPHGIGWSNWTWPGEAVYSVNVSEQIWAASVEANPGQSGTLDISFEAAHGPYGGYYPDPSGKFKGYIWGDYYYESEAANNTWWTSTDGKGIFPVVGRNYVGNYFTIEQFTKTTGGLLKRYIDISSPWNHGYLHEDMSVQGKAEIKETFQMKNLPAGNEGNTYWWDLFESGGFSVVDGYYLSGLRVNNIYGATNRSEAEVVDGWLSDVLNYHNRPDLKNELYNLYLSNQWSQVIDRLKIEIPQFDDSKALDPAKFIKLPLVTLHDNHWPYSWWWLF